MAHDDAHNLSISAIVIGSTGAAGFLLYKLKKSSTFPLLGNVSKGMIAVSIILLSIAVLILSNKRKETFGSVSNSPENAPKE